MKKVVILGCENSHADNFLGWDTNVRVEYCDLRTILTSGDAEDYGKIILSAPNKPTVDIEVCSVDAYPDFTFKVYGSKGTLKATNSNYEMKWMETEGLPPRPVVREPIMDENYNPLYCSERLPIQVESGAFEGTSFDSAVKEFYDMAYDSVMLGKPLAVTPEMASEVIRIIEICHARKPLPVRY